MESMTNCSPAEVNMKSQLNEEPKDDGIKVNGELNGSYDEEMECEDAAVISNCVSQTQSNGEVEEESSRVPSHENGVENMVVDGDVECDISETGNSNSEYCDYRDNSGSENERMESFDDGSNHMNEDDYEESTKTSDKDNDNENDGQDEEENCLDDQDQKSDICDLELKDQEDVEILDDPRSFPKELRKDALEITLVTRHPIPISQIDVEETEDEEVCEALNMSISKEPKDPLNEGTKDEVTINSVRERKTPEKSQDGDDSCIEITPEKSLKKKKSQPINVVPRRSSRNLNKTKSYADKDIYIDELDRKSDDDVEEVVPTDPLADDTKKSPKKNTIVVSDTKRLVEIAAGSKQSRGGKKEPTLVIIDTNSILSGKGAIPVSQSSLPQMTITPTPPRNAFSMLPVTVPSGISSIYTTQKHIKVTPTPAPAPQAQPKPVILPALTDDMYVVEAPSFIVPYVYEKPPVTSLKDYVTDMEKTIKEQRVKEEKERKKKKESAAEREVETISIQEEDKPKETAGTAEPSSSSEKLPEEREKDPLKEKEVDLSLEKDDTDSKPESDKSEKTEKQDKESSDKSDTETDDEIKESDDDRKRESDDVEVLTDRLKKKSDSYFDNPLGKFFMQIGVNLVQEFVQTDLLRNQKRKRDRDGKNCPPEVHMAISSLLRTLECSKENNEPYKLELKKCNLCSFKTESELVMAHHLETPHMRNYVYRCNFCTMEVRSPHDILFHMEAVHNVRGRLERAPAFHQCPNCPFEDNQKGKLSRHLLSCAKKYKPERNQEPPLDWEPPAKIPRVRGSRPTLGMTGAMYPLAPRGVHNALGRMPSPPAVPHPQRGRGRPPTLLLNRYIGDVRAGHLSGGKVLAPLRPGAMYRPSGSNAQPQVLLPTPYHLPANQMFPKSNTKVKLQSKMGGGGSGGVTAKLLQQPSISITPLPRQAAAPAAATATASGPASGSSQHPGHFARPGRPPGSSKAAFVICEICDGYIKDLEQLRNHMQWIHKVKIHPKMIYNRPPLNCQKCQFRFFTDQGLERHLLGSHGLVTSSMQEAANKGKDGGRCPVCGRVYQWKLLNHVARDHNMALKPAHLSYKCTVCTATFGMYKQFENHVYSAHSVVAKRVMPEKKSNNPQPSTSSSSSESLLKPLKINDEITIIPQPARAKTKFNFKRDEPI